MSTVLAILGALMGLGGAVAGVVYWIKRDAATAVSLDQRDAALQVEQSHVAAMEAAAAAQRAKSASEFDAKARAVSTAADAVALLRGQFPEPSKPQTP